MLSFASSLQTQCVIEVSSLFKDAVPHGDRQQAVDVVGEGTGLKKQEERHQQTHTHKHPAQTSRRRLKRHRKRIRQVIQKNMVGFFKPSLNDVTSSFN